MTPYDAPIENPYDAKTQLLDPQTPPLDEVIRLAILSAALRLRVMMPAQVIEKTGPQRVTVQPSFKARYVDGTTKDLPTVLDVPVSFIQGADYSIKVPVAVGDTGYLLFADRNIETWLAGSGGIADPQDSRAHNLSDAVFVPGLSTTSGESEDDTEDMVLKNGGATIRIMKPGRFKIMNDSAELIDQVGQLASKTKELATKTAELAQDLSTETVTVIALGTPTPLNGAAQYVILNTELQQIVTDLADIISLIGTLKG